MKTIARRAGLVRATGRFGIIFSLVVLLAGCAGIVDKPVQRNLYDFGPGPGPATASAPGAGLAPLVLADIDASGAFDGSAVLYRLGYADAHQLRPYAQARWSATPPQLVRQRLRELLGRERVVLNPGEGAAMARQNGAMPRVLRIEMEEFAQVFDSPAQSFGQLRLRATLMENTIDGERLLAQRSITAREPAPTADAPGGVRALAAATDAAAAEISRWLQQVR